MEPLIINGTTYVPASSVPTGSRAVVVVDRDWIIDRAPTRADGDSDGDVMVRMRPNSPAGVDLHWAYVKPGVPWRRTMLWEAPKPAAPASQPRRFASLTTLDGGDALAAVADDGTAWHLNSKWTEWTQLPALPDLEPESHSEN